MSVEILLRKLRDNTFLGDGRMRLWGGREGRGEGGDGLGRGRGGGLGRGVGVWFGGGMILVKMK